VACGVGGRAVNDAGRPPAGCSVALAGGVRLGTLMTRLGIDGEGGEARY
jgi:hypothetical protein